jgi:hypothetical protein
MLQTKESDMTNTKQMEKDFRRLLSERLGVVCTDIRGLCAVAGISDGVAAAMIAYECHLLGTTILAACSNMTVDQYLEAARKMFEAQKGWVERLEQEEDNA